MAQAESSVSPTPELELQELALRHLESALWTTEGGVDGSPDRVCTIRCPSLSDLADRLAELAGSPDRPDRVRLVLNRDPGSWLIAGLASFEREFAKIYGADRAEWDRYVWARYKSGLERLAAESLATFRGEYLVRARDISVPLRKLNSQGVAVVLVAQHFSEAKALLAEHGVELPSGFRGQDCLLQWMTHVPHDAPQSPGHREPGRGAPELPAATASASEARRFADLMALHPQLTPSAIQEIMQHAAETAAAQPAKIRPAVSPGADADLSSEANSFYA